MTRTVAVAVKVRVVVARATAAVKVRVVAARAVAVAVAGVAAQARYHGRSSVSHPPPPHTSAQARKTPTQGTHTWDVTSASFRPIRAFQGVHLLDGEQDLRRGERKAALSGRLRPQLYQPAPRLAVLLEHMVAYAIRGTFRARGSIPADAIAGAYMKVPSVIISERGQLSPTPDLAEMAAVEEKPFLSNLWVLKS